MALNPAQDQWDEAWSEFRAKLYRSQFFGAPSVLADPLRHLAAERLKRLGLENRIEELVRRVDALEVALGLHLDEAAKFKAEREAEKRAQPWLTGWKLP